MPALPAWSYCPTPELDAKLAPAGHAALPVFYTHPEVAGKNPTLRYLPKLVPNPVNPHALTPKVEIGGLSTGEVHRGFPLMGTIGRRSVVHFAGVTHWTITGKQMNGVRLIQVHPKSAAARGIREGDEVIVESPRGAVRGTALLWKGIREDAGVPAYEPVNLLLDDRHFDNLSGQQAYKGFACRISKAPLSKNAVEELR